MLDKSCNTNGQCKKIDNGQTREQKPWNVEPSTIGNNCINPIRLTIEKLFSKSVTEKSIISLAIGDPTLYGNLNPSQESIDALVKVVQQGKHNGYSPSMGLQTARQAIADFISVDGAKFTSDDIFICSGCASSLETSITALADPFKGQNILIPKPGFGAYKTLAVTINVKVKSYDLIPEKNWEADLNQLESQIDDKTTAIVVNNPSNPCGANYSKQHLQRILDIASRHRVPIIADEIYEKLVYPGKKFVSLASMETDVPILVCSGLSKSLLAPGWRQGWIAVCDRAGVMTEIRRILESLGQRINGSNSLVQGAIPEILQNTPQSFYDDAAAKLEKQAKVVYDRLSHVKGLTPYMPEAALYLVVKFDLEKFPDLQNGLEITKQLLNEESVFCLPGECFEMTGFIRIVITSPCDVLAEACDRIAKFAERHYVE
ncbi:tyrosine aminotransferase-like [Sitophilus oryzae]|uniref:Tyrosine aminotransferase n=1 Tax=Sitophilus oryzae TaxID=7048 RepID=A0A6J2XG65_SITOR|nr:tyrosine aminotransferase-like [Sitophilus oryzae]